MTVPASVYFWRGCVLFVGELPDLPRHAHFAAALIAGVDGPIEVRGQDDWQRCRTALLPSGLEHEVRIPAGTRFASLLFEPGTELEDWLCPPPAPTDAFQADPIVGARLLTLARALADEEDAQKREELLTAFLAEWMAPPRALDPRLRLVIERMLALPDESLSQEELAQSIGMSTSWLLHSFRAQLGLPLRRYRTYFRLKATALLLQRGESLVSAALGAGFYDQAHFNNAFRQMFGLSPGLVLRQPETMRWHVDDAGLVAGLRVGAPD